MAVVTRDGDVGAAAGASRPAAVTRLFASMAGLDWLAKVWWTSLSVGLFAGIWELCWALGWADSQLLPPPHIFLSNFGEQGRFFNTATRWQVGNAMAEGPSAFESVMITVAATTMKMAGALPMPNRKIATGNQAIGDTGESKVTVGSTSLSKTCQ